MADLALPAEAPESQATPANASHAALFSLRNKTIAITGGGRGLGLTLAAAVLEAGGSAACLDVLEAPAAEEEWAAARRTAEAHGLRLSYRRVDVTDEAGLSAALDEVAAEAEAAGAPFHGAVACAGVQQRVPAVDYPKDDFERILRVNVTGTFLTAKHSARILIKSGVGGSIVMIASMSGQVANRVSSALRASPAPLQRGLLADQLLLHQGAHLFRLQHQQGRRTPDVPLRRAGMGPAWHQDQYAEPGIYQDGHDG